MPEKGSVGFHPFVRALLKWQFHKYETQCQEQNQRDGQRIQGRIKSAAGKATRSRRLAAEGRVDIAEGRFQRKMRQLQEDFEEEERE